MNKKTRIKVVTILTVVLTIIATFTTGVFLVLLAANISQTQTVNEVNISLEEYTVNSKNEEVPYYETNKEVVPGEEVSIVPKIKNEGINCYVRAKAKLVSNQIDLEEKEKSNITFEENWEKIDDYYYYKNEVKTNQIITMFNTIKIPEDITTTDIGNELTLKIEVQAIQTENLNNQIDQNKEYNMQNLWGDTEIMQSIKRQYSYDEYTASNKMVIKYVKGADKVLNLPESIISKMGSSVPGDLIDETIEINNKSGKVSTMYLQIKEENLTQKQKDLLSNIKVVMKNSKGEIIYEGSLQIDNIIELGKYNEKETDSIKIEIQIPSDFNNEDINTLLNINFEWIFTAKYKEENILKTIAENPKTGDAIVISYILLVISLVGIFGTLKKFVNLK